MSASGGGLSRFRFSTSFENGLFVAAFFWAIAGFVAALLYCWRFDNRWTVLGTALQVGAAAGAIGSLLGFVFGVPKSLQGDAVAARPKLGLAANTSLEQISDWLTKTIVGVGLVQLKEIPGALSALGSALAPAFGNAPDSAAFAVGEILFCLIVAFILVYMWTRTRFFSVLLKSAVPADQEPGVASDPGGDRSA